MGDERLHLPLESRLMPGRHGLRPHLLAAVVRLSDRSAFAAEDRIVRHRQKTAELARAQQRSFNHFRSIDEPFFDICSIRRRRLRARDGAVESAPCYAIPGLFRLTGWRACA